MSEFDKVIGYESIKAELKKIACVLREPERFEKLGVTIPGGIMLYGVPGVGKTLMAKCFIAETGCKTYVIRKEKPNGDFVNEIKETFEKAKGDNTGVSIIFLDDMDKFANEDDSHVDAEEYVTVQSCIDDCKGQGVFVIATANDKDCMPDSLLRAGRFDKVIGMDFPKGKDAEKIIKYYLAKKKTVAEIDIEEIVRCLDYSSCAVLESVINEAGISAGYAGKEMIEHSDLINASIRKAFEESECVEPVEREDLETIAIHESGHAAIAEILLPGSVSFVTVYNGSSGVTKKVLPKTFFNSKDLQEKALIITLGGKAATEVIKGVTDVGCIDDMKEAHRTIDKFVDDYCSLGFDSHILFSSTFYLGEKRDYLIVSEMTRYYQIAKRLIIENREFYNAVLEALMDHRTITYREMQKIRERFEARGKCL